MQSFTFVIAVILLVLALLYFIVLRPWQRRWGATNDKVNRTMTGDELVHQPHFIATRAVSVNTPRAEVWKWIIQIHSSSCLETKSSQAFETRIEFQKIKE